MTSHKKPGVAFWTSVAAVGVVLYFASFGPACWAISYVNEGYPESVYWISRIYLPCGELAQLDNMVSKTLCRYAAIGVRAGSVTDIPFRDGWLEPDRDWLWK